MPIHLHNAAVSVVIDVQGLPSVSYWGTALPDDPGVLADVVRTSDPATMNSSSDAPRRVSILPGRQDDWSGTPGVEWHRAGTVAAGYVLADHSADSTKALFEVADTDGLVLIQVTYELRSSSVLVVRARVQNTSDAVIDVSALRLSMPVPQRARDLVDFTGRWSGERRSQRRQVGDGTWRRATHRGRPGHDAAFITAVGTGSFGFGHGEVWAAHVAWSGNQEQLFERLPEGAGALTGMLTVGEMLELGEVRLDPGATYETPDALFVYSNRGLDGVADAMHRSGRANLAYPRSPRPLTLNTWEAVYFDHSLERLLALADRAADIGVERFVLDDGWFRGRRDDTRGLGDWSADPETWPEGLGSLSSAVHDRGMQFGLWFEPEMINPESELAVEHPDWVLGSPDDRSFRHQFGLDLTNQDAFNYILTHLHEAVAAWQVDFIKWDHNRDLTNLVSRRTGRFATHLQTQAFYRLIDTLRAAHPGLEIESCASGGGRVDAGAMQHVQRVWPSDTNDPLERMMVQRHTALLLPPELVGAHVGPEEAHTTHRSTSLAFRLTTALFGHAGLEWDITQCSEEELQRLRAWSAMYREFRPLLHGGTTSHADGLDEGAALTTVASPDRRWALAAWSRLETSATAHSPRVRIPGLDPALRYSVTARTDLGEPSFHQVAAPSWLIGTEPVELSGAVLAVAGVPLPVLNPANTLLLEFRAILDNVN
ncbi:alpha-galactosidase [Curtobacterium sp. L1-20]|uniref:alpha-galactosidase n=1 Tax=Curtobacterium sp. L1-20 TaxID=3138181 RepID=UPI003B52DE17